MDILLSKFVKKNIDKFNITQLKDLEKFLNFDDEIILNYYNSDQKEKNIDKNQVAIIFKEFKI